MIHEVLAVGGLLLVLQSSFVKCAIWEPSNVERELVCKNDECLKKGKEYFDNLNSAVNPCDDFYTFACGAWQAHHRSPEYAVEWTVHDIVEKQLTQDLREILEQPATGRSGPELLQVKYFYDICMNQPFYGRHAPQEVAKKIINVGRYGKKSLWDIHEAYLKLTGESPFFHHGFYTLSAKELIPLLILQEVISPYGAVVHGEWQPEEERNYENFLNVLMTSLKLPGSNINLRSKIKAVIKFRHDLNKITIQSRKRTIMKNKAMTASQFQEWIKGFTIGSLKRSGMPWEKIIKTILSIIPKPKQELEITTVQEEGYFKDLERLLSSVSPELLIDHMEIYFAERHTVLTGVMDNFLERTVIEPTDLGGHIREDIPRWQMCIKHHSMWPQIGKVLQDKWFRKDISHPMLELIGGVKHAIANQIKESTWLSGPAKAETIKRILDIQPWIGYPPWYNDPSTDIHSESPMSDPMRAEAYLDIYKSVVFVKSPLLRPPFFDPSVPNLYNFGAIGYVVGHELYHVINDCGKYVDIQNFPVRWWPSAMRDKCKRQMKCFMDAYNKETQREFQLKYHETKTKANRNTYLEDYPDVMGLDAAFRLFQAARKTDKSACQTLPRFEKYSCEQMFFISFANSMCGKVPSKATAKHLINTSKHSLDAVRVNGAVQNNENFQRAFQCPRNKPMNPLVKCNLWK